MLRGTRFRLVTLGRLTLLGAAGEEDTSLAKRRFKLALLAVLAMARRPLPRDVLVGMFWPEQDEARARHSLSNALSSLRRSLGQRAITTRNAEVALASDLPLDVDALELADAVEAGDHARAIAAYGGPFLDGVYVEGSQTLEQWISRERRRIDALVVQACARQCTMLARARRWPECQQVATRWLEIEPLSSDAAIFLLNAVKAPGTRASVARALNEYETLRLRLAREFQLMPEPAVRDLAERMREQLSSLADDTASPATGAPAAESAPAPTALPTPPATPDLAAGAEATPIGAPATTLPRSRRRTSLVWALGGAAAVITIAGLVLRGSPGATPSIGHPVIAVMAMDMNHDDSTLAWLADGLPQMIGGHLARNAAVDVVPPTRLRPIAEAGGSRTSTRGVALRDAARQAGATVMATGVLSRDGTSLVLDLRVHDVASGALMQNVVLAQSDALTLADEAAARILSAATATNPGPQLAELQTTSLAAYQHYLRALDANNAGRLSEAIVELDAALALDSGFMPVLRERLVAAHNQNDTILVRRLRETMQRYDSRSTEFDRLHQQTYDAFMAGERERSHALARALIRRYPRDPRAYQLLQSILGAHGEFAEAEQIAEQGIRLDSIARATGLSPCTACVGLYAIVNLHWVRRDFAGAADWARRWIRAQPDGATAWAALAWTYSYMQRPDSALPLMLRAVSLSGSDVWAVNEYARMLIVAREYATADSVIAALEASPMVERREVGADLRAMLEREYGRPRAASRAIQRLMTIAPAWRDFGDIMEADNLRLLGQYSEAARRHEARAHTPGETSLPFPLPAQVARAFCWHHALAADASAAMGDTARLRATADTLERACSRSYYGRDWRLFHHVRGLVALRAGRAAEAEREFAAAVWTPVEGWARTTVELAAAQAALGRPRDAVASLRTAYATRLDAMGRYVPISELDYRMALAFAQGGEADSARTYGAYARRAWRNAEPEIRRLVAQLP